MTIRPTVLGSVPSHVATWLTLFIESEQFTEKEQKSVILYNNKTDVFSEFVHQFFGAFVETA